MDDETINIGCTECGLVFDIDEIYEGGCPACCSTDIVTFHEALGRIMESSLFMEQIGLEDIDD